MENIRNLELVRIHKDIQKIKETLQNCRIVSEESVINYQAILDTIEKLDTLETRVHNLAYGDCQFINHLPYTVKTTVKRRRLRIFPKNLETSQDVA